MLSAPTIIAGYQSLAISHRVNLICVDAKPGEKMDIHSPTPSRLVAFLMGVLETKMISTSVKKLAHLFQSMHNPNCTF